MRKVLFAVVCLLTLVCASQALCATNSTTYIGGSADIPFWRYYWTSDSSFNDNIFNFTNRSDLPITVNVTLYGMDGQPIASPIARHHGASSNIVPVDMQFVIPANGQHVFSLTKHYVYNFLYGHGKITWSTDEPVSSCMKPLAVTVGERGFSTNSAKSTRAHAFYQVMVDGKTWF